MAEQSQPTKFLIRDNAAIGECYANKFVGSFFDGGGVSLTFGTLRLLPERTDERPREGQLPAVYVTHRLTLSPTAAVELMNGLNTVLSALQRAQAAKPQQAPNQSH
jgi:hypothetical protein